MPFNQSPLHKRTEQQLFEDLAQRLLKAHEEPANRARELVAVDTGALKRSIRVEGPLREGNEIKVAIAAGGGEDEIDYAHWNEFVNQPFLRPVHADAWGEFRRG